MSEKQKTIEPIKIEAEGLTLIQMVTEDDDKAYFDLQNVNLDFWKEFGNIVFESVEKVTEHRLDHGNASYGVWAEDKLVGSVGYSTKGHPREAEIGALLDQGATGHGYATKAVKALTDFAKPQFNRVYAEIRTDHVDSIELIKRAGYQTSGEIVERDWGMALVFESPK